MMRVSPPSPALSARSGSFVDNMKLPVHRWFRYSAGFSADWVADVIARDENSDSLVFDPFSGSGTTLLAAQSVGRASAGTEAHGFVDRIARAKLAWTTDIDTFILRARSMLDRAHSLVEPSDTSGLLARCYTPDSLSRLMALRCAWRESANGDAVSELLWLALTAILRECSGVGTAQWQYLLPNKSKSRVLDPFVAFAARTAMMAQDMIVRGGSGTGIQADAAQLLGDARSVGSNSSLAGQVGLVVTSPPYPNNFDYADATRLEMTFWGEVESWSELHGAVRHRLVCSCAQHASADRLELDDLLADPVLRPIIDELAPVCRELDAVRVTKAGRKTYHTMVAAYFIGLAQTWSALRSLCIDGSRLCFVVGDSAPYGVHVPVERWLGQLAIAAGFGNPQFEKLRDRNVKWKNRKHRVPLHEGQLWLEG